MNRVSTGISWNVASRITPVSPMPPTVAQNTSGVPSGVTVSVSPRPGEERDRQHLVAERAVAVVALAVDVAGDRAAHGDEPGPRRDREPAARDQPLHEVLEARAGAGGDDAALEVGGDDPGQRGGVEHEAAGVLRRVAVRAAEAPGHDAPRRAPLRAGGRVGVVSGVARRARLGAVPPHPSRSTSSPGSGVRRQAT